jgi:hypothetical protein
VAFCAALGVTLAVAALVLTDVTAIAGCVGAAEKVDASETVPPRGRGTRRRCSCAEGRALPRAHVRHGLMCRRNRAG